MDLIQSFVVLYLVNVVPVQFIQFCYISCGEMRPIFAQG